MHGPAIEDYVKAIYKVSQTAERVTPSAVAEGLDISLAAVTKMVRRLVEKRLVVYERGEGIELTPSGTQVALEMIRHHRLLELYLHQALGYPWDRVDEEAEKLEHVISEEFEDRIDSLLGHPTHDPHGAPIPTKDGKIDDTRHPALADIEPGSTVLVRCVRDRDPEMLRYLGRLGLYPDTLVEVVDREPFGGPMRLRVAGNPCDVGEELARNVFVSLGEESEC
ncbi:MAG: DNA-binding protein [Gemmatimonadota bacterium]|nr:MAG: DNA-binding protein [Gemmatimonadota bacterium]